MSCHRCTSRHLQEAPLQLRVLADAILKRSHDGGTLQLEDDRGVQDGQNGQQILHARQCWSQLLQAADIQALTCAPAPAWLLQTGTRHLGPSGQHLTLLQHHSTACAGGPPTPSCCETRPSVLAAPGQLANMQRTWFHFLQPICKQHSTVC